MLDEVVVHHESQAGPRQFYTGPKRKSEGGIERARAGSLLQYHDDDDDEEDKDDDSPFWFSL